MGKRSKWNDEAIEWETGSGEFNREATIENREEEPRTPYAPCPNPDAKWKALLAVCTMPGWNGTMKGVMACLIECANYYSGKCCPSEEWMAKQLGCDQSSVKRAVKKLKSKYLSVLQRNEPTDTKWKSNAYVIGWTALINRCHAVFPWTDRKHRGATLHEQGGNIAQNRGAEMPVRPSADTPSLEGHKEKEEAFSKEEVESASTNSQPPEGPSYDEANQRVVGYCKAFHWDHLTHEEFKSAIAAEMVEVGSGRAVVDAAAQKTWALKRKGNRQ